MIPASIDAVDEAVLARLVSNSVPETRTLEFKRELPGGSDGEKKEFLADVTAFANSHGGDLVYGIEEDAGVAAAVPGVAVENPEAVRLRLEAILRDGVEPRLSGVRMAWVSFSAGTGALIIRVPQSPAGPHRIKFGNSGRFVARGGGFKYDMDTHELRLAFSASEALPARLRALHASALESANTGRNLPFRLHDRPRAVVSILPYGVLRETRDFDVTPENALAPIKSDGGFEALHLIEGVLLHSPLNADSPENSTVNSVRSYALTHRRGRIDVAWTIGGRRELGGVSPTDLVWPARFEEGLAEAVNSGIARLRQYSVEGPWLVAASVAGLAGHQLVIGRGYFSEPAWRDGAMLGEILFEQPATAEITPLCNAFWLAFGEPRTGG